VSARINQHRVAVDDRISVVVGTRIFRRHIIISHAAIREHGTDAKFVAVFVRRVMTLGNIAMKSRPFVDTQYAVHAADDAANDTANNCSHRTSIVITDASAMSGAIWYALSVGSGRHCERYGANGYGANKYNLPNHVFLKFGGECLQ
jgi:hypothetical protein